MSSQVFLSDHDLEEMLAELQQEAEQPDIGKHYQANDSEIVWTLNKPFGKWFNHSFHLRDYLTLTLTEWTFQENFNFTMKSQTEPLFGFSFCMSGGFSVKPFGRAKEFVAHARDTHIAFFQGDMQTTSEVDSGQTVSLVQIGVKPELINTLSTEVSDPSQSVLHQTFSNYQTGKSWLTITMTPAMSIALQQILQCPYQGITKQLYLESKALELITLQLHQLTEDRSTASTSLKLDDIDRIHLARDILIRNLNEPPSLLLLAKQAGINSFKLKQGFREIFNTTVFGYLHAYRMEEARRLLQLGKLNVTQVAQTVGYDHPGKFAAAFKKKFGISPKMLKSC
ncbi:AraC family transcriptional regulator [Leptolyngbyaceae cyanobacterium CCMR0082]|uniref:AraC family transcriptional regulator n=2 Tax=Adonisia turfae TaxID=2950184 RepID=A0A6M0SCE9_9CYAN|nr:AraC family transcriptional regulator [Adonisia turfae]MDV3347326.1 AraC family transcriptional regulator [Leptothoe sp. LEGE 181152]NEZ55846.1 AraC family transcriptional regulator [Adonisia turfae CCMR0081]NEZ65342.1 AraC family transcriptional regulator [Adonisia turfae CCMR0082]